MTITRGMREDEFVAAVRKITEQMRKPAGSYVFIEPGEPIRTPRPFPTISYKPPSPAIQQAAARMGISAECADKMLLTHRTHDWYWMDRYWLRALGATAA